MPNQIHKAVFLDRDGTIIDDPGYLNDPDGVIYLPGAVQALTNLYNAGFLLIIVTNQSGIARGLITPAQLAQIHERLQQDLSREGIHFHDILVAPYLPEANHSWRKPNPGMIQHALEKYDIDPALSWMVGDRDTDIEAGQRAGVSTILISSRVDSPRPQAHGKRPPDFTAANLAIASEKILSCL